MGARDRREFEEHEPLPASTDYCHRRQAASVRPVSATTTATTDYGGPFCAAVARGRLLATQFHPEKSQDSGMRLLRSFLQGD